ncbi:response regulator transcription factor [Allorhodopirellula heiligendammensis]|uniref:Transcriptional regulatory protein YycF n=1 Tax=Allorhodopirellula heiligendammensis TaxID=2714739 RepID=A0A5C6C244_9BACT|nr:response regulator transcription factor [Allorhodopirellula heiligendammensis]TWU18155.1 Transcriptional regulatory protein YycF [Allorhodopirellula heiligendammensis]
MSLSVLIIEDDRALQRGLQDNFTDAGYRVQAALDGEVGLQLAVASAPDLVVLDIMLPEMNGYHVCREIRRKGLDCHVIMLTAKGQEDDIVRGLEIGADDYMTKPFSIRELMARADRLIQRRRAAEVDQFCFGRFNLNLDACQLTRDDREIALTSKEFGLLKHLLQFRGQARTRQQILERVWGDPFIVSGRSVDRCVTTLRHKIEPDAQRPTWIQTVRDIGYRFTDERSPEIGPIQ